ncbi:hypothetical protein ACJRO7_031962 [Eucalyptus globulus]|uniref:TIR domain-containing protein n=1 Tax=Eucalyptus globulus TaxID=34317 RepID=A0ABD3JLA1_EUCGL
MTTDDATPALGDEYQIFLSFRGPDTRHGFTDFLYHDLVDAGVRVFRDEDELCVGEVIGENLLHAINGSRIYIPIFSRTYASSKWCLRELVHIVDNLSKSDVEKSILPIFFDVEPEDIKLKTPLYDDAFLEHEKRFPHEVQAWKKALAQVDEIKGWNVKNDQSQAKIVRSVVEKVLEMLEIKHKSVTELLVGADDRVKELTDLLYVNHDDVRLVGIYGMGGIGKTTLAKLVFNQLSSHFGKCCSFLENVRENSLTKKGIVHLQKKLLFDIVGCGFVEKFKDIEKGMRSIGRTLPTKKVFLVLDDVDNKEHIKKLIGKFSLHSGSRIIITTRNTTILQVEGFKGEIREYEMRKMDYCHAFQLFCRHAFGADFAWDDFHRLSSDIVSHMGGLPLAIEVVGSLLKGKDKAFWKETSVRLREVPEKEILEKLRISYNNLDEYQQQIFLDIACFFSHEKKTDAIYMWADCQLYPQRGIDVLTSRCLVKIGHNDMIQMHDQLIDMGRQIVREESSSDLGRQSRLWIAKEALEIIKTEERKDKVLALDINGSDYPIVIANDEFERLRNLRSLKLGTGTFAGDFVKCRSKLRWISWHSPHPNFKAENLYLDHLVVFKLDLNGFKDDSKAWDLIKGARNLKVLSLTRCYAITTIPDFSKCLGLERLTLAHCYNLKRIKSFIGDLQSLIELEVEWCTGIVDLPKEMGALVKLKRFSLCRCLRLRELPDSVGNLTSLTELNLSNTGIRKLPNTIGKLKSLCVLHFPRGPSFHRKHHVWQLPSGISMLVDLIDLNLSGHYKLEGEIPVEIGELSRLRSLGLNCSRISKIPETINKLHHLRTLNLVGCDGIQMLPELPTSLVCLQLLSASLLSVPNLSNLTNLITLQLSDCSDITCESKIITGCNLRWIGRLSRLKCLYLNLLNVPAPPELTSLPHLERLCLSCLNLQTLPLDGLPQLGHLHVHGCKLLRRLSIPLELRKLESMHVLDCLDLVEIKYLGLSESLKSILVCGCKSLRGISGLSYLTKLEHLEITQCMSLIKLIDASCTNTADDCIVKIEECGDSVPSIPYEMSMKCYREEFLLDTSDIESKSDKMEHPFTIKFRYGSKSSDGSAWRGWWETEMKNFTPDSVTYEGLIACMKDFGCRVKRMWYETRWEGHEDIFCEESNKGVEIKSDEQVKEMAQLASKRGFIILDVLGAVNRTEGYDDDTISMLREVWTMKTDVYSNEDGAEWDVSGPEEDLDSSSEGESQTDSTSSIDDFESEMGNAEYFEATGNRKQMTDGKVGHHGTVDEGETASIENRKEKRDETVEPAVQNVVQSTYQQCEGDEHHEMPCKATTEVEDQMEIASVKTDRTAETDPVPAKRRRREWD